MQRSQSITRHSASNLALAFVLLPKPKRAAMAALYALCREVDDVADDLNRSVEERQQGLAAWRVEIEAACAGRTTSFAVASELQPVITQFHLPLALFEELLCGVEADLTTLRYSTWEELDRYCYRVASVVGLLSIQVFGFHDNQCRDYAIALGKALQLTNILRDVRNDAERGRIYIPENELDRFGVRPEEILNLEYSDRFFRLAQSVAARARGFYAEARRSLPEVDRKAMAPAELMGSIYWRLLAKLERNRFAVFDPSLTRLSKAQKIFLIAQAWLRMGSGARASYGAA